MRHLAFLIPIALLAIGVAVAEDSLEQLKARAGSASESDRADLYLRIAQLQVKNADRLFNEGNAAQALAAVNEVAEFSEKARDSAKESKKRLKQVEIGARRMAEKLKDIKRTLAFEDQGPVEKAIQRLEDVRTTLLQEMFKKEKK